MSTDDRKDVQGEGDKDADRAYREDTREFVEKGKVDEAAKDAEHLDDEALKESRNAEEIGRSRLREEDPEVKDKNQDPDV